MTIGHQIRIIRESKGMTLDQVANITDITKQRLSAIEGSKGYPQIPTLLRIARAMGCSLAEIINAPLHLDLPCPPRVKDTDYPCAEAGRCPFFKKKE